MKELHDKLDRLNDTQIRIEADLKYHIKRTDILETQVKPMNRVYEACKILVPFITAILIFKEQILSILS